MTLEEAADLLQHARDHPGRTRLLRNARIATVCQRVRHELPRESWELLRSRLKLPQTGWIWHVLEAWLGYRPRTKNLKGEEDDEEASARA